MRTVTILEPDPQADVPLTAGKWRYVVEETDGDTCTNVGTIYVESFRVALLKLYREACPFRIATADGTVLARWGQLSVTAAKGFLEDEDVMFGRVTMTPLAEMQKGPNLFDTALYPNRVVTSDGCWHARPTCRKIKKSLVVAEPTTQDERANWWPCRSCTPCVEEMTGVGGDVSTD